MAEINIEHNETEEQQGTDWSGGNEPFKASYGKLMMWYFLLSDAFTFAGFLIAYGALRFSNANWPEPDFVFRTAPFTTNDNLPLIFVTFMSFLLIISSVTMVRGVQEGHRNNISGTAFWMLLTIIGGLGFLSCQAWEWNNLINVEGMTALTNPFSRHDQSGTYASESDLLEAGFVKKTAVVADVDDDEKSQYPPATYFLPPNTEDIAVNRYFVKRNHHQLHAGDHGDASHGDGDHGDHHGTNMAGETFDAGDPYLITYDGATQAYELGAFKYNNAGSDDGYRGYKNEAFGPKAFGGLFFFITGFHGFHVFSGVAFLTVIMINVMSGLYLKANNGHEMVEKIGLYWHFVDLVWVFVFLAFYLL